MPSHEELLQELREFLSVRQKGFSMPKRAREIAKILIPDWDTFDSRTKGAVFVAIQNNATVNAEGKVVLPENLWKRHVRIKKPIGVGIAQSPDLFIATENLKQQLVELTKRKFQKGPSFRHQFRSRRGAKKRTGRNPPTGRRRK